MEYLIVLLVLLLLAVFIEWKYKIHLYHSRKERYFVILFFFIFGILWDHLAIWRGHWSFDGSGLLGITIGLMPIEEYLFVLIVPFWIITIYKLAELEIK